MLRHHQFVLLAAQPDGSAVYARLGVEKSWTVALRAPTAEKLEISVYDFIGESFFGDGVSAKDVLAKLSAAPKATEITLRINSSGGVVDDAKAMINLLAERKTQGAKVSAFVDGIAASSASYLTTVADHVTVASNAFVMFHQARTGRMGNAKEMADTAAMLTRVNEQLADGYAAASERRGKGKTKADFLAAMAKGDTYLDADQAIEWGLADAKSEPLKAVAALADIEGLDSAPEALRAAPYVVLAVAPVTPTKESPATPALPPVAAIAGSNPEGKNTMKMVSLAAIAAVLGMTAEQVEKAEESDLLEFGKRVKAKADTEPVPSVAISGVKLVGCATEAEATAKIQDLQRGVMQVLGATGKASVAEAMPIVLAWKQGAEQSVEMTKKVAALTEEARVAKRDAAIVSSNIPPARHEWARTAFTTAEQVETFAAGLPTGFFNAVNEPKSGEETTTLTDSEKVVCKTLGMSEEQFLKEKTLLRKAG